MPGKDHSGENNQVDQGQHQERLESSDNTATAHSLGTNPVARVTYHRKSTAAGRVKGRSGDPLCTETHERGAE